MSELVAVRAGGILVLWWHHRSQDSCGSTGLGMLPVGGVGAAGAS